MVNSEKQQSMDNHDVDEVEKFICVEELEESISSSSSDDASSSSLRTSGVSEELTEFSVDDEGDDDLFIRPSDREIEQIDVFQCFQALDWQVLGACRADERLKPLLKLNVSAGAAEDRLLAHLSQHFEPSEVGMLARCLCIPLVSIRVGKIKKQGKLLCPTATRRILTIS